MVGQKQLPPNQITFYLCKIVYNVVGLSNIAYINLISVLELFLKDQDWRKDPENS